VDNHEKLLRPGMTANVTFVLQKVDNVVKIPNAALRFKPSRDQIAALMERYGGGRGSGSGGSGRRHRGSGEGSGSDGGGMGGAGRKRDPDRKQLFKLVDGKPKMVFVKLGLTDGSTTQLLEGDVDAGDQLITEIQGLPDKPGRKIGAF
ncbi:MAG: hypothetical protein ABI678_21440, partial [Kofleriaceae bacterium]